MNLNNNSPANSFNILLRIYYMPNFILGVNTGVVNKARQDLCFHEVYLISVKDSG